MSFTTRAFHGDYGDMSIRHSAMYPDMWEAVNERLNSLEQSLIDIGIVSNEQNDSSK